MGTDAVHSIANPLRTNNAALHVFAGNVFATPHLQWDAETHEQAPFDNAYMMQAYPSPA
jgi:predicted metal-dependent enzyme (double-stranded beta helix superfamily)